ncbi:MAG: IS3 family transposase [Paludibacter sp.]
MKTTQFTETQIIAMLKQHEQGVKAQEIARLNGISEKTIYRWKSKYGGMDAQELKRIKELEAENAKLKRMYAELAILNEALKDVIGKKAVKPCERKEVAAYIIESHNISIRKACEIVKLPRSTFCYKAKKKDDDTLIIELNMLVEKHVSIGFWQSYYRIRKKGILVNHKKLYRIYTSMRLNIRRRMRKRLPARVKQQLFQPTQINQVWSVDFMSDSLWNGRKIRLLNVIDDYNREILTIETDTSLPTQRVIRVLDRIGSYRGLPKMIRVDNGPEFISSKLDIWCKENDITLIFIQPGEPTQNAYIERFNGTFRRDVLNAYVFKSIKEVDDIVNEWMIDYNYNRPHKSLKNKTPMEYMTEK